MAEWYETPYKKGTPIDLPGMPRPLYSPDAAEKGKQPSVNGPDVEAVKRVVWRLGRWAGPASNFDRAYSNGFSHGKSGNVIDTGMAGVQRQAGIEDTGWFGKATYDLLRTVLIPEGSSGPGIAGDYAMDAYAQSLFIHAWNMFKGSEPKPEPPSKSTIRESALARSIRQIGTKESPSMSNRTKYGSWYGMDGSPWCAMFTTWCYEFGASDIGKDSPTFAKGKTYAYVPYIVSDARNNKNGLVVTKDPVPGDVICFDWYGDGVFDHVGLFETWSNRSEGAFNSIEGNTSIGNDSNGGEVMRRDRNLRSASIVFCRVAE